MTDSNDDLTLRIEELAREIIAQGNSEQCEWIKWCIYLLMAIEKQVIIRHPKQWPEKTALFDEALADFVLDVEGRLESGGW